MGILRVKLNLRAAVIGTALMFPAAVQAQQSATPTAVRPSAVFVKTTEATRSSFCKNARLLTCLQLDQAKCEARIGPVVSTCTKDLGAGMLTSQNEALVQGFLTGCILGAMLPANAQRSKEAVACIQQAGKK
jgi:hypothetical protein